MANDARPNHLWINQQDGTFIDEAPQRGLAYNGMGEAESDMGIAVGDIEGDGDFDVFIAHRNFETHTLWRQELPGVFFDCTASAGILGIGWRGTAFGTTFSDLDNDGDLDLLLANGDILQTSGPLPPVSPELDSFWHPYAQRDQILLNRGNGIFRDASYENADFSGVAAISRGLACGDLDNDGRLDVVVNCTADSARVFRNIAESEGNWLIVRALDPELHRDAYGAEIRVTVGSRTWLRAINPGFSFLSSNDPRAHFGLGPAPRFDSLHVIWPDGSEERFPGGETNRLLVLRRGEGAAVQQELSNDAKDNRND